MDEEKKVVVYKADPRDVFTHLLAMVTLYAGAASFLTLLFQYINLYIPDVLERTFIYESGVYTSMRNAIATLTVVFPTYVGVSWYLNTLYTQDPIRRQLRIRRWLLYFTLFATALIIMGDLVVLLTNLLNGELTNRTLLKIASVLFVAVSIFVYYVFDLRNALFRIKLFMYGVTGVVVVTTIAGFFLVGSPQQERLRKFDERRVQDLQFLQSQIINYWQGKEQLPQNLKELKDDLREIAVPSDPQTGVEYRYEVNGQISFSLCAVFSKSRDEDTVPELPNRGVSKPGYVNESWRHGAGTQCFDRSIDKDFYPPYKK